MSGAAIKIAVLQFPGSNCDQDAFHLFSSGLGLPTRFVWHKDTNLGEADLVVVPGGFSYGDYLRCGAIARFSPVMGAVRDYAGRGGVVLGICNGFQILCEAGLLPGALIRNSSLEYRCLTCDLAVADAGPAFNTQDARAADPPADWARRGKFPDRRGGQGRLEETHRRILLRYVDNPNGSLGGIAGIRNEEGNVFGMMPHPDRAFERFHPSADGLKVARAVLSLRFPEIVKLSE